MFSELVKRSLEKYAQYHQNPQNEKVHLVGIPLIMFGIIAALPLWLVTTLTIAYFLLSWREGLFIAFFATLSSPFNLWCPWYVGAIIAGVSFLIQFVSHKVYEGGYPAIFSHPEHVWAAPIWWARRVFLKPLHD